MLRAILSLMALVQDHPSLQAGLRPGAWSLERAKVLLPPRLEDLLAVRYALEAGDVDSVGGLSGLKACLSN